jgi:hypothetical protein
MKKDTIHIHLVDLPFKMSSKGKNQLKKIHLCERGKGLSVVDAFLLRKSLCKKPSFMMLNNTIRGKFSLVDPSTLDNVLSLRSGN